MQLFGRKPQAANYLEMLGFQRTNGKLTMLLKLLTLLVLFGTRDYER